MKIEYGIGAEISKALGLDPSLTQCIDIHAQCGELVTAKVTMIVGADVVLKEYKLVPKEIDITSWADWDTVYAKGDDTIPPDPGVIVTL